MGVLGACGGLGKGLGRGQRGSWDGFWRGLWGLGTSYGLLGGRRSPKVVREEVWEGSGGGPGVGLGGVCGVWGESWELFGGFWGGFRRVLGRLWRYTENVQKP